MPAWSRKAFAAASPAGKEGRQQRDARHTQRRERGQRGMRGRGDRAADARFGLRQQRIAGGTAADEILDHHADRDMVGPRGGQRIERPHQATHHRGAHGQRIGIARHARIGVGDARGGVDHAARGGGRPSPPRW
jgi:hypothetical protein